MTNKFGKIVTFAQDVQREIQKVVWPSRKEIGVTTILIVVMAAVAAVFFFFVDWGISKALRLVLGLHGLG